ncbi:MAG: 30S ribosomal protein S27ae [Nanoarchaeota archaeon]|nr:30S ribosomal protein S27ae [DPANN group archaeon]MBL7116766.1 30S ribosomal protein S27ae [Nanoarchaeota archaeon]
MAEDEQKEPVKKKKTRQLWKNYEVQGDKLVRKNRFSPKSDGDFMAEHSDRRSCGKTGYMEKK